MQSIGRNDTISVPGLCTPTTATIRPSVAAMLYAGAVEETAITTLDSSPSALASSALASSALGGSAPDLGGRRDNGRSSCLRANESGHGGVPPSARAGCRVYGSIV
jgi:hypothetical protein